MEIKKLTEELGVSTYPGRGIILGKSADNRFGVIAYFIMGRSENSRNRIFVEEGDGIRTQAFDESKMVDPSLIIYSPVKVWQGKTIVTNGDQTDTVYQAMEAGGTFESGLRTRTFEPDAPNYTPRISGIMEPANNCYRLSILKSSCGNPDSVQRFFFDYEAPLAGQGHFIHTYQQDGNPLPSFEGEPTLVEITDNAIDSFTSTVWQALDPDNKVSLFTRFIDWTSGKWETRIINKNK